MREARGGLRVGERAPCEGTRASTELRPYTFRADPGEAPAFTDGFFLIDNGSTPAPVREVEAFGVASVLIIGSNGMRRLRGSGESTRGGVDAGSGGTSGSSEGAGLGEGRTTSGCAGGKKERGLRDDGSGEGLRGPRGRDGSSREVVTARPSDEVDRTGPGE